MRIWNAGWRRGFRPPRSADRKDGFPHAMRTDREHSGSSPPLLASRMSGRAAPHLLPEAVELEAGDENTQDSETRVNADERRVWLAPSMR